MFNSVSGAGLLLIAALAALPSLRAQEVLATFDTGARPIRSSASE